MKKLFLLGIVACLTLTLVSCSKDEDSAVFSESDLYKKSTDLYEVYVGGRISYINSKGQIVLTPMVEGSGEFYNGLAPFWVYSENNIFGYELTNYGFIDESGAVKIPAIYSNTHGFIASDLCAVAQINASYESKWGYINKSGEMEIMLQYDRAEPFINGYAPVMMKSNTQESYGLINEKGEVVIPLIYSYIGFLSEGLIPVYSNGMNAAGYVDIKGNLKIGYLFGFVGIFTQGRAVVSQNGKYGFIDKDGNIVIPAIYEYGKMFSENLAAVKLGTKYGYIDVNGNMKIQAQYDDAGTFNNGLAYVKQGDYYGYINTKGESVIVPQFASASDFIGDLASVEYSDGTYGYIDKEGKLVWKNGNSNLKKANEAKAPETKLEEVQRIHRESLKYIK